MKHYMTLALLWICATLGLQAQMVQPVKFSAQLKTDGTANAEIVFTGKIDAGWHVYSTNLNGAGPTEATFNVNKLEGVELVGALQPRGKVEEKFDDMFGAKVKFFEGSATFVQKIKFTKADYNIDAYLEYGACNDETCMPPTEVAFKQNGKAPAVDAAAAKTAEAPAAKAEEKVAEEPVAEEAQAEETVDTAAVVAPIDADDELTKSLWKPVIEEMQDDNDITGKPWYIIFFMGFVGGLLALVMPCIWPIIPMTVSFFLKRSKNDKKKGVKDAITYGISIIVIYMLLGIAITLLYGPSKLNELSTNAAFNIFLFALLVVFALSFFGWFEIKLPDKWANAVDSKASATTGLLSIFLMAFTLALVSFSCTAPIIGLLLVETVTSGNWVGPAVGMFGFALALALPFTIFALFPSLLKQAPRSGSWMTTVKVVLGFIELAFALKFFSVADLAYGWHLLDREVFLSLWIVIFALLGMYLIGKLKFQEDEVGGDINKPMPVLCIMGGLVSFAFAVYMIPGLWGAPCKAVSAFAPPMNTQDFNLNNKVVEAKYLSYEEGMAAARAQNKPVLIDFTGFGCVNCRKMEAAVWTDPTVADMLNNDFILISLFVDDRAPLPKPSVIVDEEGEHTFTTVKDKWSYLEAHKFGANTQPFYVACDGYGNPLASPRSYNEDVSKYIDFLKEAKNAFKEKQ